MSRTVKDIMRPGVITCSTNLPIGQVTRRLVEHEVHALFVEDDQGTIVGLISDIDLLAGEWLFTDEDSLKVLQAVTAGELMSTPVHDVTVDATFSTTAARMAREHIHRLLVRENDKPVGVISVSDIVGGLAVQKVVQRTVQEVMSRAIVVCRLETTLPAVARGMCDRHSRAVVVVDSSGAPKGIITGLDLIRFAEDDNMVYKTAAEVMQVPITILPNASLREAADTMITHHIHRLLVVDPDEPDAMPLGLISTSDIMAEMAQPESIWQPRDRSN
jgi:CBS domain-containing protein